VFIIIVCELVTKFFACVLIRNKHFVPGIDLIYLDTVVMACSIVPSGCLSCVIALGQCVAVLSVL
jgi:hypothetical protein